MNSQQKIVLEMAQNENYTLEDIQERAGYASKLCVTQVLRQNGIKPPYPKTRNRVEKDNRNKRIIEAAIRGETNAEIAHEVGTSPEVVPAVLKLYGIQRSKPKTETRMCVFCRKPFQCETYSNMKYCSAKCQKKDADAKNGPKRRARKKSKVVDADICLKEVFKRDCGICYICGRKTDWNDTIIVNGKKYASRNYPSIDHVIPLASGGLHSWDNVRLAHLGCNSKKGTDAVANNG